MKVKYFGIVILVLFFLNNNVNGQCTHCENTTDNGINSSAIGKGTQATGQTSFASGAFSIASGDGSTSIGFRNLSSNIYTTTIGSFLKATASHAMVIGDGYGLSNELINNNAYSLMIGFSSTKPTLFISTSAGYLKTGKIGIGDVIDQYGQMNPLAKLHLRADEGEEAAVFIQPFSWIGGGAGSLALGNEFHGISAMKDRGLFFRTQSSYNFNEGYLKYGMDAREGSVLLCADSEGTAVWTQLELPAPSPWLTSGTSDIYFSAGKVGIGTINTYGYELAVLGKILADEVMIKHPVAWGDYVFKPDYNLMPLNELSLFIKKNQHLPNVPSEKEVMENGYGLAEMNEILLKKVEELTLYILEQQKVLETQQSELNVIKDQLKRK